MVPVLLGCDCVIIAISLGSPTLLDLRGSLDQLLRGGGVASSRLYVYTYLRGLLNNSVDMFVLVTSWK